jgi:hypothetical protein
MVATDADGKAENTCRNNHALPDSLLMSATPAIGISNTSNTNNTAKRLFIAWPQRQSGFERPNQNY